MLKAPAARPIPLGMGRIFIVTSQVAAVTSAATLAMYAGMWAGSHAASAALAYQHRQH